jgi:predicted MFS family arabinose efflux permease
VTPAGAAASRSALLPLIFAVTLTGILGNSLIAPALPDILDDFGIGDAGAGVVVAATSLPGIFLAPIIGLLADRYGRRNVLVPCLTTFGIFGLLAAVAPTFELLVAARIGLGIGGAGLINLAIVLIGDFWDGADRTRVIGRNAVVLTIGLAIFPPIGGLLTDAFSWRAALVPYGLALVTAFAASRLLHDHAPPDPPTVRSQLGGLGRAARQPQLLVVYAGAMIAFLLIFGILLAALPVHLEDEFGYGASVRGVFLALPAVPSMIVAFNIAAIRERIAPKALLAISSLVLAGGFALMGSTTLAVLVVIGCVAYGLGEGGLIPTLQDLSVSLAPEAQRGAVVALFVSSARLGQTVGPLGAAALFEATSTSFVMRVGALLAIGLALLFLLTPTGRTASDEPALEPA